MRRLDFHLFALGHIHGNQQGSALKQELARLLEFLQGEDMRHSWQGSLRVFQVLQPRPSGAGFLRQTGHRDVPGPQQVAHQDQLAEMERGQNDGRAALARAGQCVQALVAAALLPARLSQAIGPEGGQPAEPQFHSRAPEQEEARTGGQE